MKVSTRTPTKRYKPQPGQADTAIEFAVPKSGGNSSAGEKHGFEEKSVRLSWWNPSGGYDPISSAELPEWAFLDVVEACAQQDFLTPYDAAVVIEQLSASIARQTSSKK